MNQLCYIHTFQAPEPSPSTLLTPSGHTTLPCSPKGINPASNLTSSHHKRHTDTTSRRSSTPGFASQFCLCRNSYYTENLAHLVQRSNKLRCCFLHDFQVEKPTNEKFFQLLGESYDICSCPLLHVVAECVSYSDFNWRKHK